MKSSTEGQQVFRHSATTHKRDVQQTTAEAATAEKRRRWEAAEAARAVSVHWRGPEGLSEIRSQAGQPVNVTRYATRSLAGSDTKAVKLYD